MEVPTSSQPIHLDDESPRTSRRRASIFCTFPPVNSTLILPPLREIVTVVPEPDDGGVDPAAGMGTVVDTDAVDPTYSIPESWKATVMPCAEAVRDTALVKLWISWRPFVATLIDLLFAEPEPRREPDHEKALLASLKKLPAAT